MHKRCRRCLLRPVLADRLAFDGSLARGARRFLIQVTIWPSPPSSSSNYIIVFII